MSDIDINEVKAVMCLRMMKDYYEEKVDISSVEYPSGISYASEKWLIYMFYSCLLDYGMRSKIYHQNLINTYEKYPEIFDPKYASQNDKKLAIIMRENIRPRYPNVALQKWINLSKELIKYDSLLDEIRKFKNFDELSKFIKKIKGYGQKTGGLLLRLITEANICPFADLLFIPIDRHDTEISYLNGVIDSKNLSSSQIRALSDAWINAGRKLKINPCDVDKYLWEIGNSCCNKKNCDECPLGKTCKKELLKK